MLGSSQYTHNGRPHQLVTTLAFGALFFYYISTGQISRAFPLLLRERPRRTKEADCAADGSLV